MPLVFTYRGNLTEKTLFNPPPPLVKTPKISTIFHFTIIVFGKIYETKNQIVNTTFTFPDFFSNFYVFF